MSDEAAADLAAAIASALTAQGDAISAAIAAAASSAMGQIIGLLLVIALVALAVTKRDAILYIIAGISVLLYSYGLMDADIAANPVVKAAPVMGLGLYMIIKAGLSAATSRKNEE